MQEKVNDLHSLIVICYHWSAFGRGVAWEFW